MKTPPKYDPISLLFSAIVVAAAIAIIWWM